MSVSGCSIFHKPWHVAPKGHTTLHNAPPNERGPVQKMYLKLRHAHVQLAQRGLLAVSTLLCYGTLVKRMMVAQVQYKTLQATKRKHKKQRKTKTENETKTGILSRSGFT